MKPFVWICLFFMATAPAWAARKFTVEELKQTLVSLQQARKGDEEVSTQLKQVELSEELTQSAGNALAPYLPGPLSIEQVYVLEGRSAFLSPPPADLPTLAAPDLATQKAIVARVVEFVTKSYMQTPHLSASKTTMRFQDGVEGIRTSSGMTNNMPNIDRLWATPNQFLRLLGSHTDTTESEKGIEMVLAAKQKTPWGLNGQVSEGGPGPVLSVILQEAAAGGKLAWLHWQTVHGKKTAVFSFDVDKKQSHYEVSYCCFPITQDAGRMGYEGTEANFQTGTTWKAFKATVGYHGRFFVDPETGAILRVITQAELKPTDFVHQEDMCIDYGPVTVGGSTYFVPLQNRTLTEVVPNGDNYAARYSIRHTLFDIRYKDYRLAENPVAAQK